MFSISTPATLKIKVAGFLYACMLRVVEPIKARRNRRNKMTREQIDAVAAVAALILSAIKEAGPAGVPSGHVYAVLMGKLSLDNYNAIIRGLEKLGKITNRNHLLKAI